MKYLYRSTAVTLIAAMLASTMPAMAQSNSLTCSSDDGGYRYCRVNTQNQVTLSRQLSGSPCQQGFSWGYDYRGIWVDRGCRAQFQYGNADYNNNGNNNGNDNTSTAIAAGILGAIVIGSIVASQNNNNSNGDDFEQQRDSYLDGYRRGQRDWDQGTDPDYQRYRNRYSRSYESYFSNGYNDGFYNRPSRYR